MKPEEFIELAERLLEQPRKEADTRSAISRSYYGALHASLQCLPKRFAPTAAQLHAGGSHKNVIQALKTWGRSRVDGATSASEASHTLATLKRARVFADYCLAECVKQADVDLCVVKARRVIELVQHARKRFERAVNQPA